MADERSRLGRGLAALIGDVGVEAQSSERGRSQRKVPIEFLRPNPRNPRKAFTEAELEDLSSSIRERGIIQPIVVRSIAGKSDAYEIIAGERRWRAAQRAGMHQVPIVLHEATDAEALELAIIENVQRSDLNAMEEAAGYQQLIDQYGHSQDDVARIVAKSRAHVANTLRLLKLSERVQDLVRAGKLSAGHARQLVGQPNADELAQEIVDKGLSVRDVERWAQRAAPVPGGKEQPAKTFAKPKVPRVKPAEKDADTVALEKRLADALGLLVAVDHKDPGGTVTVTYKTLEQLDEVVRRLERGD
jgi:ParB family chromosome partitioning protein